VTVEPADRAPGAAGAGPGQDRSGKRQASEDHAGHERAGHDHAGHDRAGHDRAGHDHAGQGCATRERAARLLCWYPRDWRERYGEEFAELLIADIEERPRSAARSLDVARGGIVARLAGAGLCGVPLRDVGALTAEGAARRHVTASLLSLGCCLALFLGFGAAMWSQINIAWSWGLPADLGPGRLSPAAFANSATGIAMLALLVMAVAAALPVGLAVARRFARRQAKGLAVPSAVLIAACTVMAGGVRHFGNGWPGTGGHNGVIPGWLAAWEWAASLSVSSYWSHPGALARFPAAERAWMAGSVLSLAVIVVSAALVVRRAGLSVRVLRFETRLAASACAFMAVFLAGCCCWVATEGKPASQPGLFHAGLIDFAGVAVLTLAFAVAVQAVRTARDVLRSAPGLRPATVLPPAGRPR
jgi:hypothetical protein